MTTSTEPFRVAVFADFVCPYSYLAVDQIDRLAREYNVKPMWRPHWLHPDTPPEGCARDTSPDAAAKAGDRGAAVGGEAILDGVTVYQLTESGLALQATVKGTKYWRSSDLN